MQASCSDGELVRRACDGELEAFGLLVRRHQDYIFNSVFHMVGDRQDAEDLAQEVFMKAYRGLSGFQHEARFSTWIYGIMLNCVRSHWRRRGRRLNPMSLDAGGDDEDSSMPDPPADEDGPPEQLARKERVQMVREAIAKLPVDLKEVVTLRDLQGLSYRELSEVLEVPLGTVKSRLARARGKLKGKVIAVAGGRPEGFESQSRNQT
ncbi:MAG: sigma-70 family RNA polymerase sigma factor [Candidatus Brocadiia bacterium]